LFDLLGPLFAWLRHSNLLFLIQLYSGTYGAMQVIERGAFLFG